MSTSERLIDPRHLAPILGMTSQALAKAERRGGFPVARRTVGGHRRWVISEVVAHLRGHGVAVPPKLLALESSDGAAVATEEA